MNINQIIAIILLSHLVSQSVFGQVEIKEPLNINAQCVFNEPTLKFWTQNSRTQEFRSVQEQLYKRFERSQLTGASLIQQQALYSQALDSIAFCNVHPKLLIELRVTLAQKLHLSKGSIRCHQTSIGSNYNTICTASESNEETWRKNPVQSYY